MVNPEVKRRWIAWSAQFEGRVAWMYLDMHRDKDGNLDPLVTTGVGNLIDPVEYALPLPWRLGSALATPDVIRAEWQKVKADTSLATRGHLAAEKVTSLRLTDAAIDDMVLGKLESNDKLFIQQFRGWATLPWQAQMAIHSMGWAMGPRFGYPKFRKAVDRRDWPTAADESYIPDATNPGLVSRNKANRELLIVAASVTQAPAPVSPGSAQAPKPSWWATFMSILRSLGFRV